MSAAATEWRAFHAFYFDFADVDELLIEAGRLMRSLAPESAGWFFIRYSEGGMHLRFRLADSSGHFDDFLRGIGAKMWETAVSRGRPAAAPAGGFPDERGHFYHPGSMVEIPYVAETRRYGGPLALAENEALFAVSTSIAIDILAATCDDHPMRAKLAIDLMLAAAVAASDEAGQEGRFLEAYSRYWASQLLQTSQMPEGSHLTSSAMAASRIEKLRDHAASDAVAKSFSQSWLRRLTQANRRFRDHAARGELVSPGDGTTVADRATGEAAIADMLMSQLHMMNNRLGVPPYLEMMWAAALARSLGR